MKSIKSKEGRNMRHYFKVIRYSERHLCHVCKDATGRHLIDLMVDGGFPDTDPVQLVGKVISVSYTHPFISSGVDVKVEDDIHDPR
jgi:hypothetical protein